MQVESFFFGLAINYLDLDEITIPLTEFEVTCSKYNKKDYSPIHELVRKY